MKKIFLHILKNIPLILLSILLAFFIWLFATISSDPTEEGRFSNTVAIETVGLSDDMIITSEFNLEKDFFGTHSRKSNH